MRVKGYIELSLSAAANFRDTACEYHWNRNVCIMCGEGFGSAYFPQHLALEEIG